MEQRPLPDAVLTSARGRRAAARARPDPEASSSTSARADDEAEAGARLDEPDADDEAEETDELEAVAGARQDPLKLYVRQIGDGPLLTRAEERELARRKDAGDEAAKRRADRVRTSAS